MNKPILAAIGILIGVLAIVLYSSLFVVHQTRQALIVQFGNPIRVERDPGLKWKLPFVQDVIFYERRILDLDPPAQEVILSDQKRINIDAFARYRILDPLEFYKRVLTDSNFRQIFGGRINSSVRSEVAKADLGDLLTAKRGEVMGRMADSLKAQAPDFGVELIDLRIGRTDLPETTSQAVYNRMRSARIAEAAQIRAEGEQQKARIQAEADRDRTVILAEAEKTAQILRGEGDGVRNRLLGEAYGKDADFFNFYRSMEAYREALGGTRMVLSPDSEFFRFFGEVGGGARAPR